MNEFCRAFFYNDVDHGPHNCPKCQAAWDEVQRQEAAFAAASAMDRKNPGNERACMIGYRTTLEKAALDHRGLP